MTEIAKLVIQSGSSAGGSFDLNRDQHTLGREAPSDIVIPAAGVSRRHARIDRQGDQYLLQDLGSTNGTFVNGQRVYAGQILNPGDVIALGQNVNLRFDAPQAQPAGSATIIEADPPPPAAAPAPPAAPPPVQQSAPQVVPSTPIPTGGPGETVMGEILDTSSAPPQLIVTIRGQSQTFTLGNAAVSIGRSPESGITIDSKIVSRSHATLNRGGDGGYSISVSDGASNPVILNGRKVESAARLGHNDKLRIGGRDPGVMVSMTFISPVEAAASVETIDFGDRTTIQVGREAGNDVVLNVPQVSRFHASIEKIGQRYRVRDLRSANGTFVNNQRIDGEVWLKPNDTIRIGAHRFVMGENSLASYDESSGLRVEAVNLNKWVRKDLNILQDISLVFQPREFIVVVGQSGGGKSTLVDSIAGYRPATHGDVYVNDIEVYKNFDAIRNNIGFVPQKDIIHMELTTFQALDYAAQLRMPKDTTKAERHQRVMEVLEDLDLAHRKDVQISGLSGGQQKRVSIGVELITQPGLFFLDEPTSGLDPGTETALMQLMRRLADQGRTIVLITHATKNVVLADKVVFLARGGFMVWFGPPDEALSYFNDFRTDRDRRASEMEFDEIYALLDDTTLGSPKEWADRYAQHPAHQNYVRAPLADRAQPSRPKAAAPRAKAKNKQKVSSLRQFFILSSRNVRILTRDRFALALMLAAAPLVGLLDVVLSLALGRDPFSQADGNINDVLIIIFLMTIYAVMIGGLAQMREIVKELDIYKRERLVNLKIFPYVFSKIWVAVTLALYQAGWYILIRYLAFDMPGGITEALFLYISIAFATMGGAMIGLFASALSPNANSAPLIVILLMIPQIVMGGALIPLPQAITFPFTTRWAFESSVAISGAGSDLAKDSCWELDEGLRDSLTMEDKLGQGCNCMGTNALFVETCDFPGLGEFKNDTIGQPRPPEPPPEPAKPADPVFPEPPPEPEDQSDTVAVAEYLDDLQDYQDEVGVIEADYRAEIAIFESEIEVYQVQVEQAVEAQVQWQIGQASAVEPAEGLLNQYQMLFGWAFVDKENAGEYFGKLASTWFAQIAIMGVLVVLILVLIKRKDVN